MKAKEKLDKKVYFLTADEFKDQVRRLHFVLKKFAKLRLENQYSNHQTTFPSYFQPSYVISRLSPSIAGRFQRNFFVSFFDACQCSNEI